MPHRLNQFLVVIGFGDGGDIVPLCNALLTLLFIPVMEQR
jgi:hypothetical protein